MNMAIYEMIKNTTREFETGIDDFKYKLLNNITTAIITLLLLFWIVPPAISNGQVLDQDGSNLNLLSGQIENPLFCPSSPDIVSYERIDDTGHHLYFYHKDQQHVVALQTGQDAPQHLLANSDTLMTPMAPYTGQINWRPVLDAHGRQWFVYLRGPSTDEAQLYLSYLNADGKQEPADTYKLSFPQSVETPRWSPDGNTLVFVSRGQLYEARNIHNIIYKGKIDQFRPMQITHEPHGAYYPAWSPDGRFIAYQAVETSTGIRNVGIKIIALTSGVQQNTPPSINVTPDLQQTDETKPSWSPDGRYLAYYRSEHLTNSSGNPVHGIGITALEYDQFNDMIRRGELRKGTTELIANSVIPNRDRGPDWAVSYIRNKKYQSLVYITSGDEQQSGQMMSSSLDYWLQKRTDFNISLSSRLYMNNEKPRYGTTTLLPHHRRFLYLSREDQVESLHIEDLPTPGQPVMITTELSEHKAFNRSLLFPGLGQLYKEQKTKGVILIITETAALASFITFSSLRPGLQDRYDNWKRLHQIIPDDQQWIAMIREKRDALNLNRIIQYATGGLAIAVYAYNLIDVKSGFPLRVERKLSEARTISAGFAPQMAYFDDETVIAPGLNFRFNF